ncbi:P-loop containing nucleoside triphosphate hydrolase protein [Mycena maculata]|uniref:DNA 3'-5' helicase n=1 Tax=Mycena maculata TaxID=230809 RepID=A0AAD7KI78_9AGAR|nr:P-loop containing nucleoside triphosphate hydrolase protein [Mycena maculata]
MAMDRARQVLKDVFGFPSFRLSQEAAIAQLIERNDNALVVYPTGGGKSLCYQVPALCLDSGITLVISPLISLMKDQVDVLVQRNVKAASLDSTLSMDSASWVKAEVLSGSMKILYVAPERLNNEGFVQMMSQVKIALLAVDEAHCISQWGSSFRPEYLKIARFCEEQDVERVLCLTATATPAVVDDICKSFLIKKEGVFRTPVFRPNLSLRVEVAETLNKKLDILVPLLQSRTGPSIVYVTLQKHAEDVAESLMARGLQDVLVYHAGLPAPKRQEVQETFMKSDNGIVCCTIAFGMGIDKANIRQVIHLFMPKTLENYSQEVGRAGRDGLRSDCIMFLAAADMQILQGFCHGDTCTKRDLQLWLQEVALKALSSDGTLDFNLYEQSKTYDIRSNVLNLCYAQLELDYGFLRAITPFYSIYEITPRGSDERANIFKDQTKAAVTLRRCWRDKGNKFEANVVEIAAQTGEDRNDLAKTINRWEFSGYVQTRPSQVRSRYAVLKNPLPKTSDGIEKIADELFAGMRKREEDGVAKLRHVLELATDDDCLPRNLSKYFGGEDTVPEDGCGFCTFCTTGQGATFSPNLVVQVDKKQISAILQACHERDDPRLLARMAFGITSPRLTALKCSTNHPLFGSMVNTDFNALLTAFDAECSKVGYQGTLPPPVPKRTYSQTTTGRGGSSNKRGRRY